MCAVILSTWTLHSITVLLVISCASATVGCVTDYSTLFHYDCTAIHSVDWNSIFPLHQVLYIKTNCFKWIVKPQVSCVLMQSSSLTGQFNNKWKGCFSVRQGDNVLYLGALLSKAVLTLFEASHLPLGYTFVSHKVHLNPTLIHPFLASVHFSYCHFAIFYSSTPQGEQTHSTPTVVWVQKK